MKLEGKNGCEIMNCKYWDGKNCISSRDICLYQTRDESPEEKRERRLAGFNPIPDSAEAQDG